MRKLLVGLMLGVLMGVGGGTALAEDYVADPRERSGDHGRCQEVGDDAAGENDDNGLATAAETVVSAIEPQDDACDNSEGRRGGGD